MLPSPVRLNEINNLAGLSTLRVRAGLEGRLPPDPDLPAVLPDTSFDHAWFAAGELFDDVAKRVSFDVQVEWVVAQANVSALR
jgi:hypothetical protein